LPYTLFEGDSPAQQYRCKAKSLPCPFIKAEAVGMLNDLTIPDQKIGLNAVYHFAAGGGKCIVSCPLRGGGIAIAFYVFELQLKIGSAALAEHFPHGPYLRGVKVGKYGVVKGRVIGITILHGFIILLLKGGVEFSKEGFVGIHKEIGIGIINLGIINYNIYAAFDQAFLLTQGEISIKLGIYSLYQTV
jgi:hypothetical protein